MDYDVVLHQDDKESGIACLSTICLYYGIKNMSMSILRNFVQLDEEGNDILILGRVAEKLHFNVNICDLKFEQLIFKDEIYPVIAQTVKDGMYSHYVVVFKITKERIIVGDPSNGLMEMKWKDFKKIYTGKIIILKPSVNFTETKKYSNKYKFLIDMLLENKKEFLVLGFFTTAISGVSAISTQFYSYLLDTIVPQNSISLLIKAILGICGILLLTVELNLIKQKLLIKFNKKLDKDLVIKIYDRITNLPMSYFNSRTSGDINVRYHDGEQLRNFILSITLSIVADIGYAIWAVTVIFSISWQVLVIALLMEEIMILIQTYFKIKMEKQTRNFAQASSNLDSFVVESFNASETVKSFSAEKKMEDEMRSKFNEFQDNKYQGVLQTEVQNNLINVVNNMGNIFMLGILGVLVMSKSMTIGELVKVYMCVTYLYQPINYFILMKNQFVEVSAALERLDEIFNLRTENE